MSRFPTILGLHGVAGAGKDTTFERLVALGGDRFVRFSVADPMKESIAALFDIDLERLDQLKRDPDSYVKVGGRGLESLLTGDAYMNRLDRRLSMREFMQRYGTESHRGVFGENFWLDFWMSRVRWMQDVPKGDPPTIVNTSVRFENEAQSIIDMQGEVWTIVGPQDEGAAGHASETPLPTHLVTRYIDNTVRGYENVVDTGTGWAGDPTFAHLDDQVALILDEWKNA